MYTTCTLSILAPVYMWGYTVFVITAAFTYRWSREPIHCSNVWRHTGRGFPAVLQCCKIPALSRKCRVGRVSNFLRTMFALRLQTASMYVLISTHFCLQLRGKKGKGPGTCYRTNYMSKLEISSALQFWKWQLIGMSSLCSLHCPSLRTTGPTVLQDRYTTPPNQPH